MPKNRTSWWTLIQILAVSGAMLAEACSRHPTFGGRRMQLVLEVHADAHRIHAGNLDHAGDALRAADVVRQTAEMIRGRLAAFGLDDATVRQGQGGRLTVDLPEVRDATRIRALVTATGLIEARATAFPPMGGSGVPRQDVLAHYNGQPPNDVEILESSPLLERSDATPAVARYFAVARRPVITNSELARIRPATGQHNAPIVEFILKPMAARTFSNFTAAHIDRGLALVLDGTVVSAPVIRERISDMGVIDGNFRQADVEDLVNVVRNGPLPAAVTFQK